MHGDQDLFTYGLLLRGERNHAYLDGCVYVGPARARGGLLDQGSYPGLVRKRGVALHDRRRPSLHLRWQRVQPFFFAGGLTGSSARGGRSPSTSRPMASPWTCQMAAMAC